jgi:ferredoxin
MESAEDKIRSISRELLESGRITGLLALIADEAGVRPGFLQRPEEVSSLVLEPTYLLAPLVRALQAMDSKTTLGIVARGCDERALVELAKAGQVDLERIVLIGLACDEETARQCGCGRPYPRKIDVGQKINGKKGRATSGHPGQQIDWNAELARCLKCYGCRNACPLCICPECKIGLAMWVQTGVVPPDPLSFHLIRAFHLADKCIDCGSCQDACPAGIPLRELHRYLLKMLEERLAYVPGLEVDQQSPIFADLKRNPFLGLEIPRWMSTLAEIEPGEVKEE